jgi:hypothetical protein
MRHLYNGNTLLGSFLLDTSSGAKYLHLLSQSGIFDRISLQQIGQIGTLRSAGQVRLPFALHIRQRIFAFFFCLAALSIYNRGGKWANGQGGKNKFFLPSCHLAILPSHSCPLLRNLQFRRKFLQSLIDVVFIYLVIFINYLLQIGWQCWR